MKSEKGSEGEDPILGKINVLTDKRVGMGQFEIWIIENNQYVSIARGSIRRLGEQYFSNGVLMEKRSKGLDVFYVFHPFDLEHHPDLTYNTYNQ